MNKINDKRKATYPVTEAFRKWWATKININVSHVDAPTFERMFAWEAWSVKEAEKAKLVEALLSCYNYNGIRCVELSDLLEQNGCIYDEFNDIYTSIKNSES